MAYLLEFPPSTLPDDIRKPPYVIFGINGSSVVDKLPTRIPLKAVLHFMPKLAQYVLPAPENLPPDVAQGILRTPYVGIDIPLDIGIASFQRIILKVIQSAGMAVPKHQLQHAPSIITSISIRKTWLLLELPPAGIDGLLIHLQTQLMVGPPVKFHEIEALWAAFPSNHDMLRVMATNFVQSHIALYYHMEEFGAIRTWYTADGERYRVFKSAEDRFPDFGKMVSFQSTARVISNTLPLTESRRKQREREEFIGEEAAALAAIKRQGKKTKMGGTLTRAMSLDDMKKNETLKRSMKWKSTTDLKGETAVMEGMSEKLTSALLRVQSERAAEAEIAMTEGIKDMPQPTVDDISKILE